MDYSTMNFQVTRPGWNEEYLETNMVVLFLLEGSLTLKLQGEEWVMHSEDVLLINPGMSYTITAASGVLLARADFSPAYLTRVMKSCNFMLYCNSAADGAHSYQDIRDLFLQLTAEYTAKTRQTDLLMDCLLMGVLDTLVEHYRVSGEKLLSSDPENDVRMREIMQYIISNLDMDINLTDLADKMYVSTSTLSRIFKKNTGVYFADYVMQLRVRTSIPLLRHSEQNLTQIALNCGFANSATFSRAFRKCMDMTPTEYRDRCRAEAAKEKEEEARLEKDIREELHEKGYDRKELESLNRFSVDLNDTSGVPLKKSWGSIINIGALYDLTRANIQFHVIYLQEQLHYGYIRVWNVFSNRMLITDGSPGDSYNYDMVNQSLDFLVQHKLKPFFDFGRRPVTAIRTEGKSVFYEEDYIPFQNKETWIKALRSFFRHIVTRYGMEEVSTWIFELSHDDFHEEKLVRLYKGENYAFMDAYEEMFREIRRLIPGALFGGSGAVLPYGWDNQKKFAAACIQRNCIPDFLSFILFPYDNVTTNDGEIVRIPSQTESVEEKCVAMMRQLITETGLDKHGVRLYITEWNNSISNRNCLNDSCYRAAYIVSKLCRIRDRVDVAALMCGSDWISSYRDSVGIVNGGVGLLSKDTIRKPAFFALDFLNQVEGKVIAEGEHWLVTRNDSGSVYILCCYYSWFRRNYFLKNEDVALNEACDMTFADDRPLRIHIDLLNPEKSGSYCIKKRTLNHLHGSVLDEWKNFNFDTQLTRQDVKYLEAVSHPKLTQEKVSVGKREDKIGIEVVMEPQELVLIHIFHRE